MDKALQKTLNVAMIFDDLIIGGWTTVASAIPGFDRKNINPVIICLFGTGYYARELEKKGFEVHFLDFNKQNFVLKMVLLVRLLKEKKIDIVHTHLLLSHLIGQTAAYIAGIHGRVMHVHAAEKNPGGIYEIWMRWVAAGVKMIIPVSASVEKIFLQTYPSFKGKSKVVYNGIDICEFRRRFSEGGLKRTDFGIGEDDFCAVTVANFKSEKGHRYLIEAAALLKEEKIRFLLVGEGAEKEGIIDEARKHGIEGKIIFLGSREDVPELLSLADIMVLPSIEEGFGICLLEAFAAGIPVLATNVNGIPEITENGRNAILVSPSNPAELAHGLKNLMKDSGLREKLAKNASSRIMDFNIDKVVQGYTEAYILMTDHREHMHEDRK